MENRKLCPPKSWNDLGTHYLKVLEDPWYRMICDLENLITKYTYKFYFNKDMATIHLPITTNTISSPMGLGSDSSPVKVDLFNIPTYLADSMQFMLEYGCRIYKKGCFYIMPSFRGETADERHLCQFYHSEAEIVGTMEAAMELVEEYIKYLTLNIINEYGTKLTDNIGNIDHMYKLCSLDRVPRITFVEAVELLDESFAGKGYDKNDLFTTLNNEGEKNLIKYFDGMVWVTNYEHISLPFYQAYADLTRLYAKNADLLFGIGEVVGLGERHYSYKDVLEALERHEVDDNEYKWYCKMKEKQPLCTSGYGLGIERFVLWILKHNDIRDCQILPRFNGKMCEP